MAGRLGCPAGARSDLVSLKSVVSVKNQGECMDGRALIAIAKTYVGCHYLNGSYGAYPTGQDGDGAPTRRGGVFLIADSGSRLRSEGRP